VPHPPLAKLVVIVLISALAGAMNAIAGGGTLLTFPALIGLGIPPIVANATCTMALWPAALSSFWGYQSELQGARRWVLGFALPSLLGGAVGALLLIRTPPSRFAALVPWLVLGATGLFMVQGPLMAALRRRRGDAIRRGVDHEGDAERTRHLPPLGILLFQVAVAVYGGYFGAGAGILMLAALGLMGLTNIHRMNGLKNWGGLCMNIIASAVFAFSSLVSWPVAATMAIGSVVGGYIGSRAAQRVPQRVVRGAVIGIGVLSGIWLLVS
jgi:uncharacterized membrane protein YfcA